MPLKPAKTHQGQGTYLYCFSPPVMLATFVIETIAAAYAVWRYRLDTIGRLIVSMLLFLGLFQLSEYFVCGGAGLSSAGWARVGYGAITMLPPLGLHLLYVLAGRPGRRLVTAGYVTAVAFIVFFLGYSAAFTGYQCTGNYVIFQLAVHSGLLYGLYYYGGLTTVLALSTAWLKRRDVRQLSVGQCQSIAGLRAGYLVFLVPTAIANTVSPATRQGIPSVMCGFAVLYALILVLYILPRCGRRRPAKA